jgi:C_GCAxxG_C_C family probable redox protein
MDKKMREDIMAKARQYLDNGYHCSEGILLAVGPHYLGKVDPLAMRMATPFAGGVSGSHAELCGALAGGVMLIGALYGRSDPQVDDEPCQRLARIFRKKFIQTLGYTCCQDLKDNWVGKPGQESCALLVAQAAGVLVDVLENA